MSKVAIYWPDQLPLPRTYLLLSSTSHASIPFSEQFSSRGSTILLFLFKKKSMASLETQLAEGNQSSIYKSEGGCVKDTRIGPGLTAVIFKTQTIELTN